MYILRLNYPRECVFYTAETKISLFYSMRSNYQTIIGYDLNTAFHYGMMCRMKNFECVYTSGKHNNAIFGPQFKWNVRVANIIFSPFLKRILELQERSSMSTTAIKIDRFLDSNPMLWTTARNGFKVTQVKFMIEERG